MSLIFGYIWLFALSSAEPLPSYYTFAVLAVAVSCVIELASLVVQLVSNAFLFVRLKVCLLIVSGCADTLQIKLPIAIRFKIFHLINFLFFFILNQILSDNF